MLKRISLYLKENTGMQCARNMDAGARWSGPRAENLLESLFPSNTFLLYKEF
jgi:hypothetical protein